MKLSIIYLSFFQNKKYYTFVSMMFCLVYVFKLDRKHDLVDPKIVKTIFLFFAP
jgi:hypothetical protein